MPLDDPTRSQIRSLREAGYYAADIAERGIETPPGLPGNQHRCRAGTWA